jgi:uncharacterized integral membrane protein
MAHPEHKTPMEPLDKLTVILYRCGLTLFAGSAALKAVELLSGMLLLGIWYLPIMASGAALASANLHLYDPKLRWLVPCMSWLGFILLAFVLVLPVLYTEALLLISTCFFYAGMGMLAFKEYFCFKIPGLPLVPFLLAGVLFFQAIGAGFAAGTVLAVAALLYLWMVWAKWRMPLSFDIGDKSYYKI